MKISISEQDIVRIIIQLEKEPIKSWSETILYERVEEYSNFRNELDKEQKEAIRKITKAFNRDKSRKFLAKRLKIDYEELQKKFSTSEVFKAEIEIEEDEKDIRKTFQECSRRQKKRRTQKIWMMIEEFATKENISAKETLEFLQTRIGGSAEQSNNEVSIEAALTLYLDCNLGRQTYNKQRKLLSAAGYKILPSWGKLRKYQEDMTPPVNHLPPPFDGVYFTLKEASVYTLERLKLAYNINQKELLVVKTKYSFDGSGSHAIYHKKKRRHAQHDPHCILSP